jgi:hypothetical protein
MITTDTSKKKNRSTWTRRKDKVTLQLDVKIWFPMSGNPTAHFFMPPMKDRLRFDEIALSRV